MTTSAGLKRVWFAAAVVAVLAATYFAGGVDSPARVAAAPAQAPLPSPSPDGSTSRVSTNTVSVGGVGRVAGTPDTLVLQLGVESRGADVSKALAAANAAAGKVIAALKTSGVSAADIQTSGLGVHGNYNYDKGKQTLIDYLASQSLTVKLRNVDEAGEVISSAAAAGGNDVRINGASLDLVDNAALVTDARAGAFADAKAKAEQYATLAGRSLGQVSTVTEQVYGAPQPAPSYAMSAPAAEMARSVPIERGSQEVTVDVQVVWTLQ